jgi:hypothetical protein
MVVVASRLEPSSVAFRTSMRGEVVAQRAVDEKRQRELGTEIGLRSESGTC